MDQPWSNVPERSIQVRILFGKDIAGKQPADGRSHCRWSDAREFEALHMVAPRKEFDIANDFDAELRLHIGLVFLEPLREPRFTCQRSSGLFVARPRCIGRLAHCAAQNGCGQRVPLGAPRPALCWRNPFGIRQSGDSNPESVSKGSFPLCLPE